MATRPAGMLLVLGLAACGSGKGEPTPTPTPASDSAAQNALRGLEHAAVEKTRSDMNAIGTAITAHVSGAGALPQAASLDELASKLAPTYIRIVPRKDAWNNVFLFSSTADTWTLRAPGVDGKPETADDMVLSDAGWVKMPEGYRTVF